MHMLVTKILLYFLLVIKNNNNNYYQMYFLGYICVFLTVLSALFPHSASGSNVVAIDNKIEQAMVRLYFDFFNLPENGLTVISTAQSRP